MKGAIKDKNNYIMHSTYNEHFNLLTDAELGRLIRDVNNYVETGALPQYNEKEERVINMAFSFMKATIDLEKENYIKKCEQNKRNGARGGRPKKTNGLEENPKKANAENENPIDIDMDMDIDMGIDIDIDKNNSVCNNVRAREDFCHLGSEYKSESCFYCMKKEKCPNQESVDFRLSHPGENFKEWDKKKTQKMNNIVKDLKARGQPVNMEIFNYDWLNEKD